MTKTIAIIGGSGLYRLPFLTVSERREIDTRYGGHSAPIEMGRHRGVSVAFLARHGLNHRLLPHRINYRANLSALASLNPAAVIAVGSVGGITARAGAIVIPHQLIDYTSDRETSFADDETRFSHVDLTEPFDHVLRQALLSAGESVGVDLVDGGVYAVTNGPRLETAAEIARFKRDGADIVGMTLMPEAALARELSMPYAMICPVVNAAAGIGECAGKIDLAALDARVAGMVATVSAVIEAVIR